jgi:dihydroneopterin aldolase
MKIPSKLMEHVAGRILKKITKKFPQVSFLKIKITKTNPPMPGEMDGVSVQIEFQS